MTEAQKFMDNYPDYYGVPSGVPEPGIKGLIKGYMQNSLLGKGFGAAKNFIEGILPINERAIAENEARGAGIFTDDIGRIVTDDYNTAGGIMAGYNLNALTKEGSTALTDRKNTVMNTLENKYGLTKSAVDTLRKDPNYTGPAKTLIDRLDLFDEFEDELEGINTKKKQVYKMKKDKKARDKKKEEEEKEKIKLEKIKQKAILDAKKTSGEYTGTPGGNTGDPGGNFANIDNSGKNYGPYSNNNSSIGSSSSGSGNYSSNNNKGGGADMGGGSGSPGSSGPGGSDEMGSFAYGGRVYYMDGGLADLVDIYD
tara:strand:- start:125 stop:1057 length:933 start_codon:yes stop_codon:yes gene_type:complete